VVFSLSSVVQGMRIIIRTLLIEVYDAFHCIGRLVIRLAVAILHRTDSAGRCKLRFGYAMS